MLERKEKISKLQNEFNLLIEQHKHRLFEDFGTILEDTVSFIECQKSIKYAEKVTPVVKTKTTNIENKLINLPTIKETDNELNLTHLKNA